MIYVILSFLGKIAPKTKILFKNNELLPSINFIIYACIGFRGKNAPYLKTYKYFPFPRVPSGYISIGKSTSGLKFSLLFLIAFAVYCLESLSLVLIKIGFIYNSIFPKNGIF